MAQQSSLFSFLARTDFSTCEAMLPYHLLMNAAAPFFFHLLLSSLFPFVSTVTMLRLWGGGGGGAGAEIKNPRTQFITKKKEKKKKKNLKQELTASVLKFARFVLFRLIKKRSFNLLCVLDQFIMAHARGVHDLSSHQCLYGFR